jgi:hypothetical protein
VNAGHLSYSSLAPLLVDLATRREGLSCEVLESASDERTENARPLPVVSRNLSPH